MTDTRPGWIRAVPWLTFGLAVAIFLPNLANDFAWDDHYLVVDNPAVHSLDQASSWFADPWSAGTAQEGSRGQNALYWRPVTQASYAVDWVISGGKPWFFHLTNDLLHGLCTLLVTLLALAWGRARILSQGSVDPANERRVALGALAAGVLFAVHPVHTEAVNLVTYRTSLLATLGVLACLYFYQRGTRRALILSAACFAFGLMSKENAIVAPALIFLYDWGAGRWRDKGWRLMGRYVPFVLLAVGYLVLHQSITGPPQLDFFAHATGTERTLTMFKVVRLYVRLMIAPHPLTPFYDWSIMPIASTLWDAEVIAGIVLLALMLGAIGWGLWRRRLIPLVVCGMFLVALAPYSHVITFFDVAGERFLYLPSGLALVGLGLALTWALERRYRPRLLAIGVVAVSLLFSVMTVARAPAFDSSHALMEATVDVYPDSFAALYGLGRSFRQRGEPGRAVVHLERAHQIFPHIGAAADELAFAQCEAQLWHAAMRARQAISARGSIPFEPD